MAKRRRGGSSGGSKRTRWIRALLLTAALGGGAVGLVRAGSLVADRPLFAVKDIRVVGVRAVAPEEIVACSSLRPGEGALDVDLRAVARRVEGHPMVRRAVVSRELPHGLCIAIVERTPIAWVNLDRLYAIDEEGVLLPTPEGARPTEFPILTGAGGEADRPGQTVEGVRPCLGLLKTIRDVAPDLLNLISEIHSDPQGGLTLYLVGSGLPVRMPLEPEREHFLALRALISRPEVIARRPAYLDLRFAGQAVVGPPTGRDEGLGITPHPSSTDY